VVDVNRHGLLKIFSGAFSIKRRSQVIEFSFSLDAEMASNYCFAFFDSYRRLHSYPFRYEHKIAASKTTLGCISSQWKQPQVTVRGILNEAAGSSMAIATRVKN
jgi:hypothetical protein